MMVIGRNTLHRCQFFFSILNVYIGEKFMNLSDQICLRIDGDDR